MTDTISAQTWLDALHEHLVEARRGEVEGVHGLRVAAERLRVWLWMHGTHVLGDDLRWLRKTAGRVRDLDVALAHEESVPMRSWLSEERRARQVELEAALRSPRLVALFEGLENLPPLPARAARRGTRKLARRALAKGDALAGGDVEALHALRRALRRWRYALEWTDGRSKKVRRLQEELGEIGDLELVLSLLDRPERPIGLDGHRNHVRSEVERRARRFAERWKKRRKKLKRVES
jgi:CHAD domain-containing protein